MAWIESHQSLSRHRKTLKTAGRLSVDRHKLIGHLHELWWWALDNVGVDGKLTDMTPFEIGLAAQWDGDHSEFVEALIDGGFVDDDDGCLVLHDWYDYAGKLIERRLEERERSRRRRQQAKKEANKKQEETQKTPKKQPSDDQRSTVGTVPNRTVPNRTIDSKDNVAKKFDDDSIPMRLALHLKREILSQDPNTRVPDNLTNWATEADRMIRLDKRDPQEAANLMTWAQNDHFWRANILSMGKFRKQYDKLKRQATAPPQTRQVVGVNGETAAERLLREEIERERAEADIIDIAWSEGG